MYSKLMTAGQRNVATRAMLKLFPNGTRGVKIVTLVRVSGLLLTFLVLMRGGCCYVMTGGAGEYTFERIQLDTDVEFTVSIPMDEVCDRGLQEFKVALQIERCKA